MRLIYLTCIPFAFIFLLFPSKTEGQADNIIWHHFTWLPCCEYSNLEVPRGIMMFDNVVIEEIDRLGGFQLSIDVKDNYMFENTLENIFWRKPDLQENIHKYRTAGTTSRRVFKNVAFSIGSQWVSHANFNILKQPPEESRINGFIGYGTFKARRKVLAIDFPNTRFAVLDEFPKEWEDDAHMVDMAPSPSFTTVPINADGRRINLAFDGEPLPALTLYKWLDYRLIASEQKSEESLRYLNPYSVTDDYIMLEGRKPRRLLYFGPYQLRSHDVYRMSERDLRLGLDDGLITQAFFEDYVLILDFRNNKFGIIPPYAINK